MIVVNYRNLDDHRLCLASGELHREGRNVRGEVPAMRDLLT